MVNRLRRLVSRRISAGRPDAGVSLMEVLIGASVGMIGFVLVGTTLVSAQRQERITDETSRASDTARIAISQMVNELREATNVTMSGNDARAWFDRDADATEDVGEVVVFGLRPAGPTQRLVKNMAGTVHVLAEGLAGGSFSRAVQQNGIRLEVTLAVPGRDGRAGATVTSEVTLRGNG